MSSKAVWSEQLQGPFLGAWEDAGFAGRERDRHLGAAIVSSVFT